MNRNGFTLIELLAVILIISLLTLLVLPSITNSVKNYSNKTDELMLDMIIDATKLYVNDNSSKFLKVNGNNYCVSIRNLVDKEYLKDDIEYNGEDITDTKGVKITYNNEFNFELVDSDSCVTLAQYIKKLYNPTTTSLEVDGITYNLDETNGLMNDRLGSSSVGANEGNIRYYGANPNNYIDIGDRDSSGNIILWRIIGVFKDIEKSDETTEDLVKIIRADSIGKYSFDYTSSGSYDNNWNDATLNTLLNGAYYNSTTTSYYNNSTTATTVDFGGIGLSESVRNKVESVNWNISSLSEVTGLYINDYYVNERATETAIWPGKVALMYPSDYGYASDLRQCNQVFDSTYNTAVCKETNWLFNSATQWTITPNPGNIVFIINSAGVYGHYYYVYEVYEVRPVLYLKSDIAITGEGTTESGIKYYIVE